MPSVSESLEKTLHNALKAASERHHEYATLEHLLYALIDDDHAAEVMRACGVALDDLQSAVVHYLDTELDSLKVEGHSDPSPTSGFQRVVQRAILHVQSSGKDEVTGANVLVVRVKDVAANLIAVDPKRPGDEFLSFLPLPWIGEQIDAIGLTAGQRGLDSADRRLDLIEAHAA